ncbi:hypothetical protein NE237_028102 [Protea cynaroides]|uniref:Pollen Ole e 1 allergen and extensin family protein n=1 Tax=Protea cynaroides TaxID=273540 RepID=A0A9Q0GPM8_9MAGN|nr:hypothetical protein NE237_028102 [Protea cynaroides]
MGKLVVLLLISSVAFFTLAVDATTMYTTGRSSDGKSKVTIGVQGIIYCNSESKHVPLEGARARVTCLIVDENGYESAISVHSDKTDKNGYFLAKLTPTKLEEIEYKGILTGCKAFLSSSPLRECRVPTDVKNGMTGAPLLLPRVVPEDGMHLYSVGPFEYTTEPQSIE